ncbi:MAG: cation diffusion facilitator family transporter [Syntrophales bacterium]|nr:cation diffusion facilitator family transporter [Syntrophales bacterium]MDY0045540.1 cation diffusion facilitator family transporter [Syntrophales bacterium]
MVITEKKAEDYSILLTRSESDEKYVRKIAWIGLAVNIVLCAFKLFAGMIGSSQAIIADAIHSLSDSVTDVAVLIGSHFWSKPPDEGHPHGHRRLETLVTIFIGIILLIAGIEIARNSISSFYEKDTVPPGGIALAAAAVSIVLKEILYRWTALAGKKVRSSALIANAWHHRLDALSSIPALVAVGGAILIPRWGFLDRAGAIAVSILIVHAAIKIIWPGIREFTDAGAPKNVCDEIKKIASQAKGVSDVHTVRTRYVGTHLQVDLHLVVERTISVLEGHDIAEGVKERIIKEGPDVIDVLIHLEPKNPE